MKLFKITALSFVFVTSAASLSTMAAETARIMVKGSIVPTACSISVDGSVDFGHLTENELKGKTQEQNAYQLGYKPVNFNIQCDAAAKVALSAQADNLAAGSATIGVTSHVSDTEKSTHTKVGQLASLGQIDGKDMGYFTASLASATLDSTSADLISSQDGGTSWQAISEADNHVMYQDGSVFYGWGKGSSPREATNIAGVINISAAIVPELVENMKDVIRFNTNTTLSLQYL
ncbi:DUF1120 domain-containing protein [Serratia sp. NPDC078593]|uniref:DUF1120 domain-containing protein n=1 Tax=unclassified Serratia (in: enterobacteria) TaxID=2647522 RepID=UPI0037D3A4DC